MSPRAARVVAWSVFVLFLALCALTLGLVAFRDAGVNDEWLVVLTIGYATVGALVASRHPRNAVGWLLLAVALTFAVQGAVDAYVAGPPGPGVTAAAWVADWIWYAWLYLAVVFLPLVFPTGRLVSPRWRPVAWLGAAALGLSICGTAFLDRPLDMRPQRPNPLGASGVLGTVVEVTGPLSAALGALAFVLAAASLVLRMRRARGRERQQLKWFAYVGSVAVGGLVVASFAEVGGEDSGQWVYVLGATGWFTALLTIVIGMPVAVGFAILRHRLYDVDVVIRRTLVYGALTATLAAGYLGCVLLAQLVMSPGSGLAVAASTLVVAALFRPALARIQAVVDRRFYRRRYDARQTLESFGTRLRDEVDLDALGAELRGVVGETMQPAHVSLWIRSRS
jgi:hypothetical protein